MENELNKLIDQNHIINLEKCSDKQFISTIVITVKKTKQSYLRWTLRNLTGSFTKTSIKFQLLIFYSITSQTKKSDTKEQTLFSSLDLRYSQIPLDKKTREQCNFSLIGGNATGTFQFETGFYGLTDMPAEFQKAIDLTITNCKNTYAYLDDILIITKGSIEKHKETLEKVLHRLDEENLAIS